MSFGATVACTPQAYGGQVTLWWMGQPLTVGPPEAGVVEFGAGGDEKLGDATTEVGVVHAAVDSELPAWLGSSKDVQLGLCGTVQWSDQHRPAVKWGP